MSKLLSSKLYWPEPWKNISVMSGMPKSLTRCAGAIYSFATAKCFPSALSTARSLHRHTSYLSKFLLDLFGMKLRVTLRPDWVVISPSLNLTFSYSAGTAIISGKKPSTSTNCLTSSSFSSVRCSFTYCKTLKKRSDFTSSFSCASLKIFV